MTRVNTPATREAVEATPRRAATKKRREAIIARDGPLCAANGCSLVGTELDHRIALALGGSDTLDNWQLLCKLHHFAKTAMDVSIIAHVNRIRKRLSGERKERRGVPSPVKPWPPKGKGPKLRSRGFRASSRPTTVPERAE